MKQLFSTFCKFLPRAFFGAKFFPFVFITLLLFSCKENSSVVGLDVQPAADLLNVKEMDTLSIISSTQRDDSILTDEVRLSLLGSYNDPLLGKASSSIYTQLLPANLNPDFGSSPIVDSVVLSLTYDPAYYGKLDQQTIHVYEIGESFYYDSSYFSSQNLTVLPTDLTGTGLQYTPKPTDSVVVGGLKKIPQLRIKLSNGFGQTLLGAGGSATYSTDLQFLQFLKGIYIKTDNAFASGQGGIFSFNLTSTSTALTVYYQNSTNDSLEYSFIIKNACARFTHFDHDYTGTDVASQLANPSLGQQKCYIQSMAGLRTKVLFPYLNDLKKLKPIAINKAELIVKVDASQTIEYAALTNLAIVFIDDVGKSNFVTDYIVGNGYATESYNATTSEYRFILTRHIQEIINSEKANNGFYIIPAGTATNANRCVIGGPENTALKMDFIITYTQLN